MQDDSGGGTAGESEQLLNGILEQAKSGKVNIDVVDRLARVLEGCRQAEGFRSIIERFPDVIARFDRGNRYLYVNRPIMGYTGLSPEQLIGKTHREAGFPPGLADLWEAKLAECFSGGQPVVFEFSFISPQGEKHWHEARLLPERNVAGQIESVVCVGRETTQIKHAEEAQRRVQEEFIPILEHIGEGFVTFDRHWRHCYVNASAERMLGKKREELLGRTPWEVFPEHETTHFLPHFERAIEMNQPESFEAYCKTGHAWYECRCYPAAGGAVLFLTDVTRRKEAEQALRSSEERFRLLVEGVRDYALFLLDAEGYVVSWNEGAQRLKGYSAEEILGQHFSICYPPEDVAVGRPQQDLDAAVRTGSMRREGWLVCKGGSRCWADLALTALYREDGSLRGFAEVTRDISEHKRAEEALQQAKELAEAANRAKDQFLAVLSHELRTPLTPVLAAVCALEQSASRRASHGEVALIRRNVELEARLIDDLLDLTRITRGKIELRPEITDLNAVLRHTLQICRSEVRARQLELEMELRAQRHMVWADPARIQQVFWNLLNNAVKFTPAHGRIVVRTSEAGKERVRVEVTDSGIGIEPEVLPRLFHAFEQGDRSTTRRFGGLGLGLTISKAIVDMHGGTLAAHSEGRDKGATFVVELPTTVATARIRPAAAAPSQAAGATTVLLVEDHEDTRHIMSRLLRGLGYIVKTAAGVHEALHVLDSEPIDVLVSDLGLPDGTGYDIMQHIKQGRVRGIAVSGYGMEEDILRSRQSGFSRHLTKPIKPQDLNDAIVQLING